MSRIDILDQLYQHDRSSRIDDFNKITAPAPLSYFFTVTDVGDLRTIATSNRYAAKPDLKYKMINQIMNRRGWKIFASGTNRAVYKFMEDQSILVKTALDSVGMSDTPNEYYNQRLIGPYCTKVFETTPCGTIGLFERGHPISSREEFRSVAGDVYDIITQHLVGEYVIEDFGSDFFMNWVIRKGAYPVLCDFPYVFKLDGAKLYCNKPDPSSPTGCCGGEIDYDDGFNHLVCKKCGKRYLARDLKKAAEGKDNGILITDRKDEIAMRVKIVKGNEVIQDVDTDSTTDTYRRRTRVDKHGNVVNKMTPYEYRQAKRVPQINARIVVDHDQTMDDTTAETTQNIQKDNYVGDASSTVVSNEVGDNDKVNSAETQTEAASEELEKVQTKTTKTKKEQKPKTTKRRTTKADKEYNQKTSVKDQPKMGISSPAANDNEMKVTDDIALTPGTGQIDKVINMCKKELEDAQSGTNPKVERVDGVAITDGPSVKDTQLPINTDLDEF